MVLGQHRRAVGVFSKRQDAEIALGELRDSNFPMDRVSVITQDAAREDDIAGLDVSGDVQQSSGNKADEGATTGAITGGALGGLTGLLVGLGTLAIPGVGPILLAGAAATTIATTLAGGAIGAVAGSLIGGLVGLGIPEERARVYNDRVSQGGYLVIVEGTDEEISRAEAILHHRGIEEWGVYDRPDATASGFNRRAIGVFSQRSDADAALAELRDAGFDLSQVSLVARDYDRQRGVAGLDVRDRFDNARFGFPDERARFYNDRVDRGEYLVIVNGPDDEIRRAETTLNRHGVREWGLFDAPDFDRNRTDYARPDFTQATTPRSALVHNRRAVGVFAHRRDAEAALNELREASFPMSQISLVGKDDQGEGRLGGDVTDRTRTEAGAKAGAATGGVLGGLGGLLVGLGALAIPGIGPVLAGGALATALATSAAGGQSVLLRAVLLVH